MNTRDPDELLHDARMMEAEMKEKRAPLTDQELEEIKGRLAAEYYEKTWQIVRADIATLLAEVRRLKGALEGVRVYGSDTLSGRADGGADDREWQREAVLEMTKRARAALEGK